jgi:hypothetical protein
MFLTLALSLCLASVKAEAIGRYPEYNAQINRVGLPSVDYRRHLGFSWRRLSFVQASCDGFRYPQVRVTVDKNPSVTLYRLRHELAHFIVFAAGLPVGEHKALDRLAGR